MDLYHFPDRQQLEFVIGWMRNVSVYAHRFFFNTNIAHGRYVWEDRRFLYTLGHMESK